MPRAGDPILFLLDTLDLGPGQMIGDLLGDAPPQQLADTTHSAWISFVTRGYRAGLSTTSIGGQRCGSELLECTVVDDPRAAERALWEPVH